MQLLLSWLKEHGASFSSLTVETMGGMRGIRSGKKFDAGDTLLCVPHTLWITRERARKAETGQRIAALENRLYVAGFTYLAAFLIQAREEGSFWQPYIDSLPKFFDWHPLMFKDTDLAYLRGSQWLTEIQLLRGAIHHQYQTVIQTCFRDEPAFTQSAFTWGVLVVMTRSFGVRTNGAVVNVLVPLADMLNHAAKPNAKWYGEAGADFRFVAERAIDEGDEVLGNYGMKSRAGMFCGFGFCTERDSDGHNNSSARILLPAVPEGHPYAALANRFGVAWDADVRAFEFGMQHATPGVTSLFSYLRLMAHLEGARGMPLPAGDPDNPAEIPPLGRENEIRALSWLSQICVQRLRAFETSIEEDSLLLEQGCLPAPLHFAVMVRQGEKLVLQHFIDLATMAIPVLKSGASLHRLADLDERFSGYFTEVGKHLEQTA